MSLPDYGSTEYGLLRLLGNAPSGAMHCQDVYRLLACEFPQLTREDTSSPYRRSLSRWVRITCSSRACTWCCGWNFSPALSADVESGSFPNEAGAPWRNSTNTSRSSWRISRGTSTEAEAMKVAGPTLAVCHFSRPPATARRAYMGALALHLTVPTTAASSAATPTPSTATKAHTVARVLVPSLTTGIQPVRPASSAECAPVWNARALGEVRLTTNGRAWN